MTNSHQCDLQQRSGDCNPSAAARPIVFDLFCGLGGWTEAFLAEGYRAIGFDVEAHDYGKGGYPGELVLADIRSLSGSELVREYGVPACIVASPPCNEFSYMAMSWSKAKEKERRILSSPTEQTRLTDLFQQCFRIQREVSESAGRYTPMVVENVRGAQKWVGKARWNFGSFYLWGDVPALMPIPSRKILKDGVTHRSNGETNFHGQQLPAGNTTSPLWSERPISRLCDAYKGFAPVGQPLGKNTLSHSGSKSNARKEASAMIARIPFPLASWIAKTFKTA